MATDNVRVLGSQAPCCKGRFWRAPFTLETEGYYGSVDTAHYDSAVTTDRTNLPLLAFTKLSPGSKSLTTTRAVNMKS